MDNNNGGWESWSKHVLIELSRLHDEQCGQGKTLVENTRQLEMHIAGVRLAREQNEILRDDFNLRKRELDARLEPLEDQHIKLNAYWKILTVLALAPAGLYYLWLLLKLIKGGD